MFIINSEARPARHRKGQGQAGRRRRPDRGHPVRGAEGATTTHGGDIVVWTSGTGAYGGLTFNGSVIKAGQGHERGPATGPEAEALRKNLASVW